ncbi:8293_t:CDS:2, partial [Entrophospora sp. SA101]
MSSELYEKTCEFLTNSSLKRISAVPVVYQAIVEEPWIDQNVLKELIQRAVNNVSRLYHPESQQYKKLIKIPQQFDIAYEGICGLCDMGVVKTNEGLLSSKEIMKNMMELKSKLAGHSSHLSNELYKTLKDVSYRDLTWKDPLASQVISDNSNIVRKLTVDEYNNFMKPALQMVPPTIPVVQEMCTKFVSNFVEPREYTIAEVAHDGTWKESNEVLLGVATGILDVLNNSWKNSAFAPEFESSYISIAEKQSTASADRKGKFGKRPDLMFILKHKEFAYELVYGEFSRLVCTEDKKENDNIKLWRETNDGMFWAHKKYKPAKDEFGIIGLQVAGRTLHLNVLIKDKADVHRYYHLKSVEIPIQKTGETIVAEFVQTLLVLRKVNLIRLVTGVALKYSETSAVDSIGIIA